ncbi:2883_t:CDS:2 [Ambispora gerdemannii]|uniref:2883_t:CDS:1 n=1 Tax=Ambispora gerdemannii TaxID=144530 RepID=A0A9N8WF48_9GLOM|nr:2883_t:CDS:2 [Ambispora gerdemannii]
MSEQNLIFEAIHTSKNLSSGDDAKSEYYNTKNNKEVDSNRGGVSINNKTLGNSTAKTSNSSNPPKINFSVLKPPQPVKLGEDEVDRSLELHSESSTAPNVKLETTTSTPQPNHVTSQQSLNTHIPNNQQEQKPLPTTEIEADKKKRKRSRWDQAGSNQTATIPTTPQSSTATRRTAKSNSAPSQIYTSADKRQFAKFSDTYKPGMIKVGSKWVYPEDEIIDGGTWEHKKRAEEMKRTADQAALLTQQAEAKRAHHIADFLPKEELHKFESKVKAVKTGEVSPSYEDYANNKLDPTNIGFKMLMKQGWQAGSGLGKSGEGIAAPINKADTRPANAGLGQTKPDGVEEEDDEFEIYRKRMMLAYRFRPNPLSRPPFLLLGFLLRPPLSLYL